MFDGIDHTWLTSVVLTNTSSISSAIRIIYFAYAYLTVSYMT